jgi:hypothetical protein
MGLSTCILVLAALSLGETIPAHDIQHQQAAFQAMWNEDFVWKLKDLPQKGGVPEHRVPYSGYIYPDNRGGTARVLRMYDQAFHRGRSLAQSHEQWDTTAFKEKVPGFFGNVFNVQRTPDWYGHCNGWTSATILHAEPQRNVVRNGVTFSPADIKGLLAELYVYNEHIVLGGENEAPISAGVFHAILANWLGRREQALGMEADPGEEKWNYPAYAFASTLAKHSEYRIEVNTNLVYALDSESEWDESPRIKDVKFFHYMLELNAAGDIVGGYFFRDSSNIDMLWAPLPIRKPGQPGNPDGNPYVDVEQVLSIWRDSVPAEVRNQWSNMKWQSDPAKPTAAAPVNVAVTDDAADFAKTANRGNASKEKNVAEVIDAAEVVAAARPASQPSRPQTPPPALSKFIFVPLPIRATDLPQSILSAGSDNAVPATE